MVGIVIVSHSEKLAEGVAELARGAGGEGLALAATGGLDLPGRPLGTDAALVLRAIDEVYSDDGVLVLMDLGSAVLSAELALDMLSPERRAHVTLCEAPLVEGAVAAAVQSRLGSPLSEVLDEARGALAAKAEQLNPTGHAPEEAGPAAKSESAANPAAGVTRELRLTVRNQNGLHARPAAQFVRLAAAFHSEQITIRNLSAGRGPANAKSMTAVLIVAVRQGDEISLTATGPNATTALDALAALLSQDL